MEGVFDANRCFNLHSIQIASYLIAIITFLHSILCIELTMCVYTVKYPENEYGHEGSIRDDRKTILFYLGPEVIVLIGASCLIVFALSSKKWFAFMFVIFISSHIVYSTLMLIVTGVLATNFLLNIGGLYIYLFWALHVIRFGTTISFIYVLRSLFMKGSSSENSKQML